MRNLSRNEILDILHGCTILGTGGGGDLSEGLEYIDEAFALGKSFRLISASEVPRGEILCTPYILGAISPLSQAEESVYNNLPRLNKRAIMTAYERLLAYTGKSIYGTICCELGGSNTALSFYLAAMFDGYIIDADPAGRAVPEITHSTYYLNNLPAAPIITANEFGECFICENIVDDARAETLVRALAKVSRNDIAAIDHVLSVEEIKDALIHGTISKALSLGKEARIAKQNLEDVADVIANKGEGFVAFRGKVNVFDFSTEDGFTLGSVSLDGTGEFSGQTLHIRVKNENMLVEIDGSIYATVPDLICCINTLTGDAITNPHYQQNMPVAVIILPAPKEFLTDKGLSVFGPRYAGIDQDYCAAKPRS